LGLDVLRAHDASLDMRCHMLQLGDEEVPLQLPAQCDNKSRWCGWRDPCSWWIPSQGWVPGLPIKLKLECWSSREVP
jgi:hypothetical protein